MKFRKFCSLSALLLTLIVLPVLPVYAGGAGFDIGVNSGVTGQDFDAAIGPFGAFVIGGGQEKAGSNADAAGGVLFFGSAGGDVYSTSGKITDTYVFVMPMTGGMFTGVFNHNMAMTESGVDLFVLGLGGVTGFIEGEAKEINFAMAIKPGADASAGQFGAGGYEGQADALLVGETGIAGWVAVEGTSYAGVGLQRESDYRGNLAEAGAATSVDVGLIGYNYGLANTGGNQFGVGAGGAEVNTRMNWIYGTSTDGNARGCYKFTGSGVASLDVYSASWNQRIPNGGIVGSNAGASLSINECID